MIAKDIIFSDGFSKLSAEARLFYLYLCVDTDDWGFVSAPMGVARICGLGTRVTNRVLEELDNAGYIFRINDVICIRHFNKHNSNLRKDRRKDTLYSAEKSVLKEDENQIYQLKK